jgi:hypothetical protein
MPGLLGDYVYGSGLEPRPTALVVSRKIDPHTKDYERESDGLPVAEKSIRMRVLLALSQIRGEYYPDPAFGDDSNRIDRDQAGLIKTVYRNAALALKDMIDAGEVEIVRVDVTVGEGKWARAVLWRVPGDVTPTRTTV